MLGSYIDLLDGHVRVYGLPWQGAATSRTLEGMAQALQAFHAQEDASLIDYRLLMMHTGLDGIVPRVQGLPTMAQFQPLRQHIDYLALGHVHKPYEFDGWMYNLARLRPVARRRLNGKIVVTTMLKLIPMSLRELLMLSVKNVSIMRNIW